MNDLAAYMPFLIPIAVIEVALAVVALIHVLRHNTYRFGNRVIWSFVVIILTIIGPIVYFTVGRGDD